MSKAVTVVVALFATCVFCANTALAGPRCYHCDSGLCDRTTTCPSGQDCYVAFGPQRHSVGPTMRSGCMLHAACQALPSLPKDLYPCIRCCTGDLCNRECNVTSATTTSIQTQGTRCYNCRNYDPHFGCNQITTCGQDFNCFISFGNSGHNRNAGCLLKQACQQATSMIGKRSVISSTNCFQCCSSNLCNKNCTQGQI